MISLAGCWMMARRLSRLPLPLLPAGAVGIAAGVGLLAGEDGGLVAVHGLVRLRGGPQLSRDETGAARVIDPHLPMKQMS